MSAAAGRGAGVGPAAAADDLACVAAQLGRAPRGVLGVAHRCPCGRPDVVATAPRLPDGTPFPTAYYLTHPAYVAEASRIESHGTMAEWTAELAEDGELAAAYAAAHRAYLADRAAIGEAAGKRMSLLVDALRASGISADMSYGGRGLKGAMKGADRAGAKFALVLGERELEAGQVAVKNLADHSQVDVPLNVEAVIGEIRRGA